MPRVLSSLERVQAMLRREVDSAGVQSAWARENRIDPAYISNALSGVRLPQSAILKALKLEKVPAYARTKKPL